MTLTGTKTTIDQRTSSRGTRNIWGSHYMGGVHLAWHPGSVPLSAEPSSILYPWPYPLSWPYPISTAIPYIHGHTLYPWPYPISMVIPFIHSHILYPWPCSILYPRPYPISRKATPQSRMWISPPQKKNPASTAAASSASVLIYGG